MTFPISPQRLLRRDERWGADQAAGLGLRAGLRGRADLRPGPRPLRCQSLHSGRRLFAEDLGQPPIHDLDFAESADHDVGRLEVSVDDTVGVGVADRLAHGLEDGQQPAAVGR